MIGEDILSFPSWLHGVPPRAQEPMVGRERRQWASFLRRKELARAVEIINSPCRTASSGVPSRISNCGLAVLGPWGVGKTTFARNVEFHLAQTHHIVRLFGSTAAQSAPFDAFALLLARLPSTILASPAAVVEGLSSLIRTDAGDLPVLFIVDEIPDLDPMSLGVIMNELICGNAKILVMARKRSDLPQDLVCLLKDGCLEEFRLGNFSHDEVAELIQKATGTFVSETAVSALHRASHGNPLVLESLFNDQISGGNMHLVRDGWVIEGPPGPNPDNSLTRILNTRLNMESALVREGVQEMALLHKARLAVVIDALGNDTVNALEEAGYLSVSPRGPNYTELREEYLGDAMRRQLSPARKAQLYAQANEGANLHLLMSEPEEIMSLAAWMLDAELPLSSSYALIAAREANDHLDPMLALRCAATVMPEDALWLFAVQARAVALMNLGENLRAVKELEAADAEALKSLGAAALAHWVVLLTQALLCVPSGADKVPHRLATAAARVARLAITAADDQVAEARRLLRVAHCMLEVHQGNFAVVVGELESGSKFDADPSFALDCASLLVPTYAAMGREVEAISLNQRVLRQAALLGRPLTFGHYSRRGLMAALLWSGQWRECEEMLRSEMQSMTASPFHVSGMMQLELGLAQVFAGRAGPAVESLKAACAQLEVASGNGALTVAYSALALAYAQLRNDHESTRHLALAVGVGDPLDWIDLAMAQILQMGVRQWLDDPKAAEGMIAAARLDISQKRFSSAGVLLFTALIRGSDKDYSLLEETARQCQGPLARLSATLARSARDRDAVQASSAAVLAQELGSEVVESRCMAMVVDFARAYGDVVLARNAQLRFNELKGCLKAVPLEPASSGVELTRRERQIARLAKRGVGNREIAERIGVSVRTVEGHLYQAYGKLGVATRTELEQVLEL